VDFPCVYRAPAGFDSIAQAAGRCNREGILVDADDRPIPGRVYVFDTEELPPPGMLRNAAEVARELSSEYADVLEPDAIEAYFKLLYWTRQHAWDRVGVMSCFEYDPRQLQHGKLAPFQFRTAAARYRLICEEQTPVLVPYNDEAKAMIENIKADRPIDYAFFREAQKYSVSLRDAVLEKLDDNRTLYRHESAGLWALLNERGYSSKKGMLPNVVGMGPEALMW
jgi:CRISPR-associated endonuclease/helicase Cas3